MKITYLFAAIRFPNEGARITSGDELRKIINNKFIRETVAEIRKITCPGTGKVLSTQEKEEVAVLKRRLGLGIFSGYSKPDVEHWRMEDYAYCQLCIDVDKGLDPKTTEAEVTAEYKRMLAADGKSFDGRCLMVMQIPSGAPNLRYTIRVPFSESQLDGKLDLEREVKYFGKFEKNIDKGCTATAVRPQWLGGEVLFLDEENLFNLPDDWSQHVLAELAKPDRKKAPKVPQLVSPSQQHCSLPLWGSWRGLSIEEYLNRRPFDRQGLLTEGQRNRTLFRVAVRVKKHFQSVEDLINALKPFTTLSDEEVESVCRSAWKSLTF